MAAELDDPPLSESFLLLFFKKEALALLALLEVVDAGLRRHDDYGLWV